MRSAKAVRTVTAALLAFSVAGCSDMRFWEHNRHHGSQARMASVDLNSASRRQLADLPGLDQQDADRIIQNRPYNRKRDLVDRNIIGPKKFDQVSEYVYVSGGGSRSSGR